MDLATYIRNNKLTQHEFGRRVGVSAGMVWQWLAWLEGKPGRLARITPQRAIEIEKATDGLVTREELRPDIFERAA